VPVRAAAFAEESLRLKLSAFHATQKPPEFLPTMRVFLHPNNLQLCLSRLALLCLTVQEVQALVAAGSIRETQRNLLSEVAKGLGIGKIELAQIEVLVRSQFNRASGRSGGVSLEEAYQVLGVPSGATDKEIKTAYRRLMNQHHPDKLVARGLPKSMTEVAEKKTQEIRAAYEHIKRQRNIK